MPSAMPSTPPSEKAMSNPLRSTLLRLRHLLFPALPPPSPPASPQNERPNEATGRWGEDLAANYLRKQGFKILEQRARVKKGELDIVALGTDSQGAFLLFVEVKTRRTEGFGGPEAALDRRKRAALQRSIIQYLHRLPPPIPRFRIDLIAVIGTPDSATTPILRHTPNVLLLNPRIHPSWIRTTHP